MLSLLMAMPARPLIFSKSAVEATGGEGANGKITAALIKDIIDNPNLLYDKNGEEHYNLISALHKSMRGGDADAAVVLFSAE